MNGSRVVVVTRMEKRGGFSARCYHTNNGKQCPFYIEGSYAECIRKGTTHVHDKSLAVETRVRFGKLHRNYSKLVFTETDEA
jgi:hypothetical protein